MFRRSHTVIMKHINAFPDDGGTAPKHIGAVLMLILMLILKLFLRQFTCASVGELKKKTLIKLMVLVVIYIYLFYKQLFSCLATTPLFSTFKED